MRHAEFLLSAIRRLMGASGRKTRRDLGEVERQADRWEAVVADEPLALAEMHRELLDQQGIPAAVQTLGIGQGALGGVPSAARVLVPAPHAREAREILGLDDDAIDDDVEPVGGADRDDESERTVERGER